MEDDVYARVVFVGTGAYTPSTTEKHRRIELAKAVNYDPSRRICASGAETLWISMLHHAAFQAGSPHNVPRGGWSVPLGNRSPLCWDFFCWWGI